jgi:DNA-binding MarR family transcriptional regulator
MPRFSIKELKASGVSQEDINEGLRLQSIQRANGVSVQPLAVIVGKIDQYPLDKMSPNVVNLTSLALRKRGSYEQAALLVDQSALSEKSPERAALARGASKVLKELALSKQLEFDFWSGNVSLAHQYQDAITERLYSSAITRAQANEAMAVLWQITRHLGWQTYECTKTAADLCDITGLKPSDMSVTLAILEQVGAIVRVKRGRVKLITVTPEGAFRGNVNNHAKVVERYKLEVIEGGLSA